jgi:peroxiredoxin
LDGRTVSLSDYLGKKKLVLVFWASWNNASHPQMMLTNMIYQNNHTPESEFDVVGVSLDDDQAAARKFASDSKILFPVVLDPARKVTDAYKVRSVPTVLLVGTDGKVAYGNAGFNRSGQNELVRELGLRPSDVRMEMGAPNGRRGN